MTLTISNEQNVQEDAPRVRPLPGKTLDYILSLSGVGRDDAPADLEAAGGKGASLARLANAGLPVPQGFIVSTQAYRQFVAENRLQAEILAILDNVDGARPSTQENAACLIHERFSAAQIPPEIARRIVRAYADLPGHSPAVAVRSSATAEDLPEASFAGQQETYLNIKGSEAVLDAVKQCWASLWTARAIGYRARQGISSEGVALAVVVQLLVPAEAAGILFTAHPVTGERHQAMISAAWGLGAAAVGGLVTPDSITVDKQSGRVLERTTADKHVMTVRTAVGTEEQPVPENLRRMPVLGDQQATELTWLGIAIERLYHTPMDIEWARHDGKFAILQARPITALPGQMQAEPSDHYGWNDSLSSDSMWSNNNFGEAITEVMTPLTWSVLQFTLEDWSFMPGRAVVGNIGGYPYINISVFASLFRAMGRGRQDLLNELEAIMYLRLPEEMEIPTFQLSRRALVSSIISAMRVQGKQLWGARTAAAYVKANPEWFRQTLGHIRQEEKPSGLAALFRNEMASHLKHGAWCVLGSANGSANYTIQLRRELTHLVGLDDANILIANVSERSETLMSLGPLLGLAQVARGELSQNSYLEQYGHRGPHEFELSVPHPAEDPTWLERELAVYRQSPVDVEALLQKQRETFDATWQRLNSCYPQKATALRRRMAESARRARLREQVRSEYVRDRWAVRTFALRAGEVSGLGDDVFFLTLDEVLDVLAGDRTATRYIPARRETYLQHKALPSYPTVIRGRFDPSEWATDPQRRYDLFDAQAAHSRSTCKQDRANMITGSPGSAGQVEGRVRRLNNVGEGSQLQPGEILVAVQTDIAWTLLFPRTAAVVTDVGAPLSHAAIVARELGIPAVVGCGNATQRLKTGDRVRVDGGRGSVEILDT